MTIGVWDSNWRSIQNKICIWIKLKKNTYPSFLFPASLVFLVNWNDNIKCSCSVFLYTNPQIPNGQLWWLRNCISLTWRVSAFSSGWSVFRCFFSAVSTFLAVFREFSEYLGFGGSGSGSGGAVAGSGISLASTGVISMEMDTLSCSILKFRKTDNLYLVFFRMIIEY